MNPGSLTLEPVFSLLSPTACCAKEPTAAASREEAGFGGGKKAPNFFPSIATIHYFAIHLYIYVCVCVCVCVYIYVYMYLGFPHGSDIKESYCNSRDPGLITGSGRSPGEGNSYPLQYSCLGNPMNRGA